MTAHQYVQMIKIENAVLHLPVWGLDGHQEKDSSEVLASMGKWGRVASFSPTPRRLVHGQGLGGT